MSHPILDALARHEARPRPESASEQILAARHRARSETHPILRAIAARAAPPALVVVPPAAPSAPTPAPLLPVSLDYTREAFALLDALRAVDAAKAAAIAATDPPSPPEAA